MAIAEAETTDHAVQLVLFFCLIAAEAVNTAVECVVDYRAPDRAVFAHDTMDLGALATMCLLCAKGVFLGAVLPRSLVSK